MQLHTLTTNNPKRPKTRRGRGGKRGTFSGRGTKGQRARAGRRMRPEMRDIIKKFPKMRGHRQLLPRSANAAIKARMIAKKFKPGEIVSPKTLAEKGLIRRVSGKIPPVKILEAGDFLKGLTIKNCTISRT